MRYAIVSDIHANLRAWDAVLADLRSQGADAIICLGDVVGYGPNPAQVLAAVRAETSHFVLGNHDAAAAGMMDYSIFNAHARQAIKWTMTELTPEATAFLASVPLAIEAGDILFVHAEISEPGRFDYIDSPELAQQNFAANQHFVTFVGHTHKPKIFELDEQDCVHELLDETCALNPAKRYIVNVGSVGEPRNPDDLRARYAIYNSETREVDFRKVEFDIVAYRADLQATSLALHPYFLQVYEQVVEGREIDASANVGLVNMRVAHDSAALIDLKRVSSTVHMQLASAKPSRAPTIALAAVAALTLAVVGFWLLKSGEKKDLPEEQVIVVKSEPEETKAAPAEPVVAQEVPAQRDTRMAEVEKPAPKEKEPKAAPAPPKAVPPTPKPIVETKKVPIKTISWSMDQGAEGASLIDQGKQVTLKSVAKGKAMNGIAPDPVPLTQKENKSALQIGIWQEETAGSHFALTSGASFTFEGWFLVGKSQRPIFLLGTRTGVEDKTGWHLDLRPPSAGKEEGKMSFFYDSGEKQIQALAKAVVFADLQPHHFALVWDHDASRESGEMKLFLDGAEVATAPLPHSEIVGKQVNPFRIGAKGNPKRLALDELKFTQDALQAHEFLLKTPILGAKMIKSDPKDHNSWGDPANWAGGKIPEGKDNIIIEEGLSVQAEGGSPKPYSGLLVLKEGAVLTIRDNQSLRALPKAPSSLVMHQDSRLLMRTGDHTFGPIELKGDAEIWGGATTHAHRATRRFAGKISGEGKLILNGVHSNKLRIEAANSFSGGLLAKSTQKHPFTVYASASRALGKGDVTLDEAAGMIINAKGGNVISDSATLHIKGKGLIRVGNRHCKIVLHADETVSKFLIDGVDQGEGVFTSKSHPILGGGGKLTVKSSQD